MVTGATKGLGRAVVEKMLTDQPNVLGTYFMMVAAHEWMKGRARGSIINISSIDAYIPHTTNAHSVSKATVVSITRSFVLAVANDGITVNFVAFRPLATEKAKLADWYEDAVRALPTGHPIESAEVANNSVISR